MACLHMNFRSKVAVLRLSHVEGGPITGYAADVSINCVECGLAFRFAGLPAGNSHTEPRVSIDGTELRAPIEPASHEKFAPVASYTFPGRATH